MKKIIISVICDCGEKVTEQDMDKQKLVESILVVGKAHYVSLALLAEEIVAQFGEERPSKPEKHEGDCPDECAKCCIQHADPMAKPSIDRRTKVKIRF